MEKFALVASQMSLQLVFLEIGIFASPTLERAIKLDFWTVYGDMMVIFLVTHHLIRKLFMAILAVSKL
jgi:hypothetical protein